MKPHVSVVVPTSRRPALLDRCLAALVAQTCDSITYEILVVDDAPARETREVVARWATRSRAPVRYLATEGGRGPASARNRGWRAAQGEFIACTDDDCVPARGWLQAGVAAFTTYPGEDEVAAVWGRIVVPLPPAPTDYELNAAGLEGATMATANCFYRRAVLAATGGFDERFRLAWREDSDLYLTLVERGARLVHASTALVVHPVRPARWGVSLRQQRKSLYNALLYKKHPTGYRQRIQATPPWRYYRIVLVLLLTLGGGARRNWRLAFTGGVVWAVLTGCFCAERLARTSRAPGHLAEMVVTSALIPPLAIFWRLYGALRFRVCFL